MSNFPQYLVVFFFLLRTSIVLSQRSCPPSYCGNLQIKFPLWLKNSPRLFLADYYCGFPDLGVDCVNNEVILHAGNSTYLVEFFNQNSTRYTFKDRDLLDSPCPRTRHNLTLIMDPGFPLRRGGNFSIFLYINCTVKDYPLPLGYEPLPTCIGDGKAKDSFVVYSDASSKFAKDQGLECEDILESPVKKFLEGGNLSSGFAGVLQGGFEMVVSADMVVQCVSCEVLNGVCTDAMIGGTELYEFKCSVVIGINTGRNLIVAASLDGGFAFFFCILTILIICLIRRRRRNKQSTIEIFGDTLALRNNINAPIDHHGELTHFGFDAVTMATNNFPLENKL